MSFLMHAQRRRLAKAFSGGMMLAFLLAGCSYGVKRVQNPVAMPVAWDAQVHAAAAAEVPDQWWKSFDSPVLDGLIDRALRDNPGMIAAEERLKQAERSFQRQREDLFPDLSVSVGTNRTYAGGNRQPSVTSSSTSLGIGTGHAFDLFGASAARYRINAASLVGTRYETRIARTTLAQTVCRAYFNLLGIRSQVEVAHRNLEIAERLLRIAEVRVREGVSRQFDLTQQSTQVLQQRTQLIPLENRMRAAETALGLLLGETPQAFRIEGEPIDRFSIPEIVPWIPSELLLRRPDIAAAELDMANARANLDVARASLIPVTLQLNAGANAGSTRLLSLTDARSWSIGGALQVAESIFGFRQRRTNVLNLESQEYVALIQYAHTIRNALKDIDDTLANAEAIRKAELVTGDTLENTRRSLALAELEYLEGSANRQEVLDAQRSLYSAEQSLVSARLDRLLTAVDLYVALGGGWTAPAESEP